MDKWPLQSTCTNCGGKALWRKWEIHLFWLIFAHSKMYSKHHSSVFPVAHFMSPLCPWSWRNARFSTVLKLLYQLKEFHTTTQFQGTFSKCIMPHYHKLLGYSIPSALTPVGFPGFLLGFWEYSTIWSHMSMYCRASCVARDLLKGAVLSTVVELRYKSRVYLPLLSSGKET